MSSNASISPTTGSSSGGAGAASPSITSSTTATLATAAGVVDFPFNYLHAEIVRYFKERDAEAKTRKSEWAERVAQSEFAQVLQDNEKIVSNLIFTQDNAESRLESIGYRVGFALVERIAKDVPRITNELEAVKFICKEFWSIAFGKPVDNLRTNHRGIYIIQDNRFIAVSAFSNGLQFLEQSAIFLALPCGVIRGALTNLGAVGAIVTSEVDTLPRVKFNIQINKPQREFV